MNAKEKPQFLAGFVAKNNKFRGELRSESAKTTVFAKNCSFCGLWAELRSESAKTVVFSQ